MSEADLGDFIAAAGNGLGAAQRELAGEALPVTALALSDAALDAKVVFGSQGVGIRPVTLDLAASGAIDPAHVSTVSIRYVAVPGRADVTPPPRKDRDAVLDAFRKRPDVARLGEILGDLDLDATFVPSVRSWVVVARVDGATVRDEVIPDEEEV